MSLEVNLDLVSLELLSTKVIHHMNAIHSETSKDKLQQCLERDVAADIIKRKF